MDNGSHYKTLANNGYCYKAIPICHVLSYESELESITLSNYCAGFYAYRSSESGNITLLFFHVTSGDHMMKETCELMRGIPST